MANLGRGDNADETSLAAATAAIITARWGGPPRRAQTPEPSRRDEPADLDLNGGGRFGSGSAAAAYSAAAGSARATATVDRPPPPPLIDRDPSGDVAGGRGTFRGAASAPMFSPVTPSSMPEVFSSPELPMRTAEPPMRTAEPPTRAAEPAAYLPEPPPYGPDPLAFPPSLEPLAFPRGPELVAAEPPPYLPEPRPYVPDPTRQPEYGPPPAENLFTPNPYPPADPSPRPMSEPAMFKPVIPVQRAPAAAAPPPIPAPPVAASAPVPAPLIAPPPMAPPPMLPPPVVPSAGSAAPSYPAPRPVSAPPADALDSPEYAPAAAPMDDFAGSVMAGLAFPEPFVPEPYDPGAFHLPDYGSDGAVANGYDHTAGNANAGSNGNGYGPVARTESKPDSEPAREPEASRRGGRRAEPDPLDQDTEAMLPRRVPAVPDVPDLFLANDAAEDSVELTRIASYLREEKNDETDNRPDGFDVAMVLAAVRGVPGVSDAQLRWKSGYGHTLRVEFVAGADEEEVTRAVAGMLRHSMGLAAQPGGAPAPRAADEIRRPVMAAAGTTAGGLAAGGMTAAGTTAAGMAPALPGYSAAAQVIAGANAGAGLRADGARADMARGRPFPAPGAVGGSPRVVLDHVQVTTLGVDASVEVRLQVAGGSLAGAIAKGSSRGPAVDAYLLRLACAAAGDAIDQLLVDQAAGTARGRCFIEHVAVVPFGSVEVAVVVLLLICGSAAEQLSGSVVVTGDPREAVVRATLSAVNRRLEPLLA